MKRRACAGWPTLCLGALLALAGCESQARQDPLLVRGSTNATVFSDGTIYIDRPLAENLENSLIFADYDALLRRTGMLATLRGPGPFTVFAIVDPAIDDIPPVYRARMVDPANAAGLARLVSYTVVPGRYTLATLRAMMRAGGGRATLLTIDHDRLGVTTDAAGTHVLLTDPTGRTAALVLADIIQSNGLLYAANRVLAPN